MKLTIEIPDSALRAAVDAEVSRAIANLAESVIQSRLDDVMSRKMEHLSKNIVGKVDKSISRHVEVAMDSIMGKTGYDKKQFIQGIINSAFILSVKKS